ncbi:hypothetical protein Q9L58_009743 [Maublancomyces gigas]|uniref:Uncharacterized protein n=1 Tax=Discina gigas TaxID=1032678 RepID=A0ABR3G6E3_9PEZI
MDSTTPKATTWREALHAVTHDALYHRKCLDLTTTTDQLTVVPEPQPTWHAKALEPENKTKLEEIFIEGLNDERELVNALNNEIRELFGTAKSREAAKSGLQTLQAKFKQENQENIEYQSKDIETFIGNLGDEEYSEAVHYWGLLSPKGIEFLKEAMGELSKCLKEISRDFFTIMDRFEDLDKKVQEKFEFAKLK